MDKKILVEKLNEMLAQEHACAIRYATHAATITGPYAEPIAERLKEISADEIEHAAELRERILGLNGTPTLKVSLEDLKPASTLEEMLAINIAEEVQAIKAYQEILKAVPQENAILYNTLQSIIQDEQEHLEELENLRP